MSIRGAIRSIELCILLLRSTGSAAARFGTGVPPTSSAKFGHLPAVDAGRTPASISNTRGRIQTVPVILLLLNQILDLYAQNSYRFCLVNLEQYNESFSKLAASAKPKFRPHFELCCHNST